MSSGRDWGPPGPAATSPPEGVGAAISPCLGHCWKISKQRKKPHFPSPPGGDETGAGAAQESRAALPAAAGITMTARDN